MNKSDTIGELAKALSIFQMQVRQPMKDKANPFFKSKYVPLENVVEAITETAGNHGLSFIQYPLNKEDQVGVITILMHSSGEWIESEPIFAKPGKQDAQAAGSVITYLKRYSLSAVFGITSDEDDDGERSMDRNNGSQQTYQNQSKQQYKNDNQPPAQQNSNLISDAQIKLVKTKLSICAHRDTEQMKLIYTTALNNLGIEQNTQSKDLTKSQASKVIDYLNNLEPKK